MWRHPTSSVFNSGYGALPYSGLVGGPPAYTSGGFSSGVIGLPTYGGFSRETMMAPSQFDLEMRACHEERAFLNALWKDPNDDAVRQQYVDFLLDKNRVRSAELVRGGYTPGIG